MAKSKSGAPIKTNGIGLPAEGIVGAVVMPEGTGVLVSLTTTMISVGVADGPVVAVADGPVVGV